MGRLFVFGIGGTGSRVIKSLSFLLASGVKVRHCDELVPILIDPHANNLDLMRTDEILRLYQKIREPLGDGNNRFFGTKISALSSLVVGANENGSASCISQLEGIKGRKFKEYIDFDGLSPANKALASLMFSKENLDTEMDVGFFGNPNIGSVVLNAYRYSKDFKDFSNCFEEGDRIFIISSIFGGTGAAGFPILLKNIRGAALNDEISAKDLLKNAPIGALSVLPYFNVEYDKESKIQKADWIQKSKAALSYYERSVTGNKSVNAMYYVGDTVTKTYNNDSGEGGQRNAAHFIELVGALSIIDFANTEDSELQCANGKALDPHAREFGVREEVPTLNFNHLGDQTELLISKNFIQFAMMYKHLKERIHQDKKGQVYQTRTDPKIDEGFFNTPFYRNHLMDFLKHFREWCDEMSGNKRAFSPLNLNSGINDLVVDIPTSKKQFLFGRKKLGYGDIDDKLTEIEAKSTFSSAPKKLLNLMYDATSEIISEYFDRFKQ